MTMLEAFTVEVLTARLNVKVISASRATVFEEVAGVEEVKVKAGAVSYQAMVSSF